MRKGALAKTHEAGKLASFLKSKKFTPERWKEDKKKLIEKYNELGYRDAVIVEDVVVSPQIIVAEADWVIVPAHDGEFHLRGCHGGARHGGGHSPIVHSLGEVAFRGRAENFGGFL